MTTQQLTVYTAADLPGSGGQLPFTQAVLFPEAYVLRESPAAIEVRFPHQGKTLWLARSQVCSLKQDGKPINDIHHLSHAGDHGSILVPLFICKKQNLVKQR